MRGADPVPDRVMKYSNFLSLIVSTGGVELGFLYVYAGIDDDVVINCKLL